MNALITARNLTVDFGADPVVRGIDFTLQAGHCLALVGESGSGKSVTARSLLGLSGGSVRADALSVCGRDALALGDRDWQQLRGTQVTMILQDALTALDPLRPIGRDRRRRGIERVALRWRPS